MPYFKIILFSCCLFLGSFTSCGSRQSTADSSSVALQSFDSAHTSRNSLDWAGTYSGNFPCDDCDAEEMIIKIKSNGNFVKTKRNIGKSEPIIVSSGKFSWNKRGNKITLYEQSGESSYLVGEGRLLKNEEKNDQSFQHASDKDFLIKEDFSIKEIYWKLTRLNQNSVDIFEMEPHLIFKNEGKVKGFGSCNPFNAKYKLLDTDHIKISGMDIQKESCPAYNSEQEFLKALQSVESYDILGDVLFFLDAGGYQIAQFEAVYLN